MNGQTDRENIFAWLYNSRLEASIPKTQVRVTLILHQQVLLFLRINPVVESMVLFPRRQFYISAPDKSGSRSKVSLCGIVALILDIIQTHKHQYSNTEHMVHVGSKTP